ncbi:TPA: hypothetical protein ACVO40_004627 [Vibrio diabolicus]
MYRHKIGDIENKIIAMIRDQEIQNPAPFSNKEVLDFSDEDVKNEIFFDVAGKSPKDIICDVPVLNILGVSGTNNFDNFEKGMTFRDVLFNCLHGKSLITESLDYFSGSDVKSDLHRSHKGYVEFPQDQACSGKEYARRGVGLIGWEDRFYVSQGKQRSIIAMFWIYQNYGSAGAYRNVGVTKYI